MRNDDSPLVSESLRELKHPFIIRSSIWYVDGETAVWGTGMNLPLKLSWDWLDEVSCKTSPNVAQEAWLTLADSLSFRFCNYITIQEKSFRSDNRSKSAL